MIFFTVTSSRPRSWLAYWIGSGRPSEWGKSEPKTRQSAPTTSMARWTFSSGNGATPKLRLKMLDGRPGRVPHLGLRPSRAAWSSLRTRYGSHGVPNSAIRTLMFGNRPKRLWNIMAVMVSMTGRSDQ